MNNADEPAVPSWSRLALGATGASLSGMIAVLIFIMMYSVPPAQAADGGSGLPIPRFVSLKSDRVNVRKGPGLDYPVAWVYQRIGLPVEIVKEFENWRQVRDSEGTEGWVLQNLLSGRRTALVTPWDLKATNAAKPTALRDSGSDSATIVAMLEPGVLASVVACDRAWCQISVSGQRGYVEQTRLFGVYPDETVR